MTTEINYSTYPETGKPISKEIIKLVTDLRDEILEGALPDHDSELEQITFDACYFPTNDFIRVKVNLPITTVYAPNRHTMNGKWFVNWVQVIGDTYTLDICRSFESFEDYVNRLINGDSNS